MALKELWKTAHKEIQDKHVQRVIGFAGDGKLRDEQRRYRGTQGEIGFDGLWISPDENGLVVEIKANDAIISREVVMLKTELERFREQVQNVE
jgi:hypothetical protein